MRWETVVQRALEEGQRLGAVGPGPIEGQMAHAAGLLPLLPPGPALGLDLGTGTGLPGLVLAALRPDMTWTLVDAAARRIRVVADAVTELGWGDRIRVVHGRAAELALDSTYAGTQDVVVSRSFAGPATTAEEARPFLRLGGRLVVAEPPDAVDGRWPLAGLEAFGYVLGESLPSPRAQVLTVVGPALVPVPRRDGVARKRPRW